jgi:hypothetical protein
MRIQSKLLIHGANLMLRKATPDRLRPLKGRQVLARQTLEVQEQRWLNLPRMRARVQKSTSYLQYGSSSAAGGLFEQTAHQQRLSRRHLYLSHTAIDHLGLAASPCRITLVSCLCSDWYSERRRPDIMT